MTLASDIKDAAQQISSEALASYIKLMTQYNDSSDSSMRDTAIASVREKYGTKLNPTEYAIWRRAVVLPIFEEINKQVRASASRLAAKHGGSDSLISISIDDQLDAELKNVFESSDAVFPTPKSTRDKFTLPKTHENLAELLHYSSVKRKRVEFTLPRFAPEPTTAAPIVDITKGM